MTRANSQSPNGSLPSLGFSPATAQAPAYSAVRTNIMVAFPGQVKGRGRISTGLQELAWPTKASADTTG